MLEFPDPSTYTIKSPTSNFNVPPIASAASAFSFNWSNTSLFIS